MAMTIRTTELIDQLQSDVRKLILAGSKLKSEDVAVLQRQPGEGKWSVAQVLAHLNTYGKYYIPAMRHAMTAANATEKEWYRAGWLGDYFTKLMEPRPDGSVSMKMKAPKNSRPLPVFDVAEVLEEFLTQQHALLDLLQEARRRNLAAIRIPTTLSKMIRLKLGDTFRFMVAHERRHFVQIERALEGS